MLPTFDEQSHVKNANRMWRRKLRQQHQRLAGWGSFSVVKIIEQCYFESKGLKWAKWTTFHSCVLFLLFESQFKLNSIFCWKKPCSKYKRKVQNREYNIQPTYLFNWINFHLAHRGRKGKRKLKYPQLFLNNKKTKKHRFEAY
jgi:hypothetical protein